MQINSLRHNSILDKLDQSSFDQSYLDQGFSGFTAWNGGNVWATASTLTANLPNSSHTAASLNGTTTDTVSSAGSGIVFNNTFTANVNQAYENCIIAAEQTIASEWTNSITINLKFDAEAEGTSGTDLATNSWSGFHVSYATLKSALTSLSAQEPNNTVMQQAVASLPSADPSDGAGFSLQFAYAQMLGLTSSTKNPDATVTLNTSYNWSYGQDVTNAIEHEISEGGMGRVGGLGDQNSDWSTMDLFRYTASGVPDYSDGRDGQKTYFSYDGGKTLSLSANLSFNNQFNSSGTKLNTGDTADFTQQDVFGTGRTGETNTLSQTDLEIMDALGWNPAATVTVSTTSFTVAAQQLVAASSFFTVTNPNGHNITQYSFEDAGGGSGHFTLAGSVEPNGQAFMVSASNLSSVQYAGGTSGGTDTLVVDAYDATVGVWMSPVSVSATTTAPFPFVNNNDVTEAVYIGYFGRAGDPAGDAFWLNNLSGGLSLNSMAASFSVQTEATAQYAFLANPPTATQAQIVSFIESVYGDLFNRAANSSGLSFWQNYLTSNLGNPQAVGAFILAVIDGAQGSDQATIANKVTAADYLTQAFAAASISFSSSASAANTLAHSAIASVTSANSTVLAAEATINSFVATQSSAAEVVLVGSSQTSEVSSIGHL